MIALYSFVTALDAGMTFASIFGVRHFDLALDISASACSGLSVSDPSLRRSMYWSSTSFTMRFLREQRDLPIVHVGNGKVGIDRDAVPVAPQVPRARRMKRSKDQHPRTLFANEPVETRAHLGRRLVRKGDDDALVWRDGRTLLVAENEPGNARREHARLAGPRTREDLQRPLRRARHRRPLRVRQGLQAQRVVHGRVEARGSANRWGEIVGAREDGG